MGSGGERVKQNVSGFECRSEVGCTSRVDAQVEWQGE